MPSKRPTSSAHKGAMDDLAQQYGSHSVSGGSFSDDDFSDELPSYASHRPSARDPGVGRSSQGGEHRSLRDPRHGMPSQMGSRRSGMPPSPGSIPPPGASSRHSSSRQPHGRHLPHMHSQAHPSGASGLGQGSRGHTSSSSGGHLRTASQDPRSGKWLLDGPGPLVEVNPYVDNGLCHPRSWITEKPVFSDNGTMFCGRCKTGDPFIGGLCWPCMELEGIKEREYCERTGRYPDGSPYRGR